MSCVTVLIEEMVLNKRVRQLHGCGCQFIEKFVLTCRKHAQPEAGNASSNACKWGSSSPSSASILRPQVSYSPVASASVMTNRACHMRRARSWCCASRVTERWSHSCHSHAGVDESGGVGGLSVEQGIIARQRYAHANKPTSAPKPGLERRAAGERKVLKRQVGTVVEGTLQEIVCQTMVCLIKRTKRTVLND